MTSIKSDPVIMMAPESIPAVSDVIDSDEDEFSCSSSDSDSDSEDESVLQRVKALQDVVPYSTRSKLRHIASASFNWGTWLGRIGGNLAWVAATTVLMVVFPVIYCNDREKMIQMANQNPEEFQKAVQAGLMGPEADKMQKRENA